MTLGASALARPLRVTHSSHLHFPLLAMIAALVAALALAWRPRRLNRAGGIILLACYPTFVIAVLIVR
jgi:cation:H+ antiporter